MTQLLDSPLKITGFMLTCAGIFLSIFSIEPLFPDGQSLIFLGLMVLLTEWAIKRSPLGLRQRNVFEIALVVLIILLSAFMALDFYGLIGLSKMVALR